MNIIALLFGAVHVEVRGMSPEQVLNSCAVAGVKFFSAESVDDFSLCFKVGRRDFTKIENIAVRNHCELRVLSKSGLPYFAAGIRQRYALFAGLLLSLFALLCSSLFIWEIEVTGNETVPTSRILSALEEIDIGLGTYWPSIVIYRVRNEMLRKIPELSWITVNISGSRAQVKVRERTIRPEIVDINIPANIVAAKAGVVTSVGAFMGAPSVRAGDTVLPWDILISSEVTSLYSETRYVHALGEVEARTWYEITAATPLENIQKIRTGQQMTRMALRLGQKRINFYFDSGISQVSCDKMVKESTLKLPGGFILPFTLLTESFDFYYTEKGRVDLDAELTRLEDNLYDRLLEGLGPGGSIVSSFFTHHEGGGLLYVTLRAECREEIGMQSAINDLQIGG